MNPEHDEDVRALFDSTAAEASGPVLTKLKARAQDIPGAAQRSWLSRFAAPAFALVTGGAAAVFLLKATPETPIPVATTVAVATAHAPAASEPLASPRDPAGLMEESEGDMGGLESVAWADPDDLWSGAGLEAEADSEELLAALDSWMEEDG